MVARNFNTRHMLMSPERSSCEHAGYIVHVAWRMKIHPVWLLLCQLLLCEEVGRGLVGGRARTRKWKAKAAGDTAEVSIRAGSTQAALDPSRSWFQVKSEPTKARKGGTPP